MLSHGLKGCPQPSWPGLRDFFSHARSLTVREVSYRTGCAYAVYLNHSRRRGGRVAEGGGLLNRYRALKPYRGFESHPLRQLKGPCRALFYWRLADLRAPNQ